MNIKRFILASIAVFVTFQALDFIIHGLILMSTYQSLTHLWRPDMMSLMWIMYLSSFFMSFMFVYIFTKGYENRGIMEGLRFGVVIGLFMNVVGMFSQYAMYPIPFSLTMQWFLYGMAEFIIAGIVAAAVYRPAEK
jgi:hypothetical protein